MSQRSEEPGAATARLAEAAGAGERVEVILVLRGKVRRAASNGGWRIRLDGGRVVTFRPDAVVAVTPLPGRRS